MAVLGRGSKVIGGALKTELGRTDVETALGRLLAQLDRVCSQRDADQFLSRLLRKIDVVTGLSAWSDPKQVN